MKTNLAILLMVVFVSVAGAENWPAWRGATGMGLTTETNLPVRWDSKTNVRWRTALPERGNSTPIVWGDRVFITQAIEENRQRLVMCFDRANGALLWRAGVTNAEAELTHATNPHGAGSPVTDGERVIASFASAGVYCYDFNGKELWKRDLGKLHHIWGAAVSPMLHGDLCILNFGPGARTFLIALNKKTGKTVWQVDEPGGDAGENKPGEKAKWIGSWSTPVAIKTNGREELLMSWPQRVAAYDPKDGKELWTCSGLNPLAYTSPIFADGVVLGMGGFNGSALAVKAGGSGDVTSTHRIWQIPKTRQRIGSGVIAGGHIYILNDPGVAECIELKTGKVVWEERLKGPGAKSDSWSSMVLSGDKLYVINQSGDTFVLRASPKFELLATNPLGETTMASLAPSDGEIFVRTYKGLWCIGKSTRTAGMMSPGFYTDSEAQALLELERGADRVLNCNSALEFDLGIGKLERGVRSPIYFKPEEVRHFLQTEKRKNLLVVRCDKSIMWNKEKEMNRLTGAVETFVRDLGYERVIILGNHSQGVFVIKDVQKSDGHVSSQ